MAMPDFTVILLSNSHVARIGVDGRFHNARVVTIKVGPFGPFTQEFPEDAQGPDAINEWKNRMVQEVIATL